MHTDDYETMPLFHLYSTNVSVAGDIGYNVNDKLINNSDIWIFSKKKLGNFAIICEGNGLSRVPWQAFIEIGKLNFLKHILNKKRNFHSKPNAFNKPSKMHCKISAIFKLRHVNADLLLAAFVAVLNAIRLHMNPGP